MPLQPIYLVAVKNLRPFMDAIRHAQAPDKLGLRFIEELGFKSTNDRLFIPLLKAMKFVDESGKPTARYHSFLDDSEWQRVLADGVRDAFSDLFRVNKNAHTFTREQLTGKLKTLGEGKLSPAVLANMTKTFGELVKLGDFSGMTSEPPTSLEKREDSKGQTNQPERLTSTSQPPVGDRDNAQALPTPSLVYRIEIVLPAVRDQAVYDAIFRSAREHLMR